MTKLKVSYTEGHVIPVVDNFFFRCFHSWNILWTKNWKDNYLRRNTKVRASKNDGTPLSRKQKASKCFLLSQF